MVMTLMSRQTVDEEIKGVLGALVPALSVAVERETMWRALEREREKFYESSIHDALTQLYTRFYMRETLSRLFHLHDRSGLNRLSVLLLDIDHFKKINDHHGHLVGDEVLRQVAALLLSETRKSDLQVRFGGEEFALFLQETDPLVAVQIAERILVQCQARVFPKPGEPGITLSCGLTERLRGESLNALLDRADRALYQAKTTGRNRVIADFRPPVGSGL
jgi:diguanylate cyclase (GGDEF)-like protein